MAHIAYIALGSNLGDRAENLAAARAGMEAGIHIVEASKVYETPPWGYEDQPVFLNQVIKGETELSPEPLLTFLKDLEGQMGRRKTVRYGPRVIDLDILFYDDLIYESPRLTVPHPRLSERAFVLVPLAEIAPDLRHPVLGVTVKQLLEQVDASGIRPYSPDSS